MSPKIKLLIIVWILVAIVWGFFIFMSSVSDKTTKWPKEFNVWVVWDETAWYSDIISWFKNRFKEYAKTEIKFTKFSNYKDYEKILLNVMSDGNSPDIFVVNNNSMSSNWNWLLESKIIGLNSSMIDIDFFSKNFNKLFDELIIQNTEIDENNKKINVSYLKWIPMWFETLWVFYNFRKVRNIPETWEELDNEIENNSLQDYSTIALGAWWKNIQQSSSILTAMFLQNWINTYSKIQEDAALRALKMYNSYYDDTYNNLSQFSNEFTELWLTTTDLFVRWKIWMLIWFPSLAKEISLAIKRTSWSASLWQNTLRTAPMFQFSKWNEEQEKVNLVNYNFFALSKYSKSQDMWIKFLNYLASNESQNSYISNFPYYLPAMKSLEETRLNESVDSSFERTKLKDFYPAWIELKTFEKWLVREYDDFFINNLWVIKEPKDLLLKANDYISCNVNHIIWWTDFEKECN